MSHLKARAALRLEALSWFHAHVKSLEAQFGRPFRDETDLGVAPVVKHLRHAFNAHAQRATGLAPQPYRAIEAGEIAIKLEQGVAIQEHALRLAATLASKVASATVLG